MLRKLRQEDQDSEAILYYNKFKTSLCCTVRLFQKNKKSRQSKYCHSTKHSFKLPCVTFFCGDLLKESQMERLCCLLPEVGGKICRRRLHTERRLDTHSLVNRRLLPHLEVITLTKCPSNLSFSWVLLCCCCFLSLKLGCP